MVGREHEGLAHAGERRVVGAVGGALHEGNGLARWGWAECRDPKKLEEILDEMGIPRVAPRDSTRLRTLATILRG